MFIKYYTEQSIDSPPVYDPALFGGNALRTLYEQCHSNGYGTAGVSAACNAISNSRRTLRDFTYIGADVQCSETMLGNFWLALYLKDLPAGAQDLRFTLRENAEGMPPLATSLANLTAGGKLWQSTSVREYTGLPQAVLVDPAVKSVSITFSANKANPQSIYQVVLIDAFGSVIDVFRNDAQKWTQTYAMHRDGRRVERIYAVAASSDVWISVDLTAEDAIATPDVTITPWNCIEGTHYEVDPLRWAWLWLSPDIWLDNSGLGRSSGKLNAGQSNQLTIRLRNQGGADATNVAVDVDFQPAGTLPLDPNAWQPILASDGSASRLTGLTLAAGDVQPWTLPWTPPAPLADTPVALRVRIQCPSDPNTTNKVAMTILSSPEVSYRDIPIERKLPVWADPLYDPPRHRLQTFSTGPRTVAVEQFSRVPVERKKTKAGSSEKYLLRLVMNERAVAGRHTSRTGNGGDSLPQVDRLQPRAAAPHSLPPGGEQVDYVSLHFPAVSGHGMGLSLPVDRQSLLSDGKQRKKRSKR